MAECGESLVIFSGLRKRAAEFVVVKPVVGIDVDRFLKSFDRLATLTGRKINVTETKISVVGVWGQLQSVLKFGNSFRTLPRRVVDTAQGDVNLWQVRIQAQRLLSSSKRFLRPE